MENQKVEKMEAEREKKRNFMRNGMTRQKREEKKKKKESRNKHIRKGFAFLILFFYLELLFESFFCILSLHYMAQFWPSFNL